MRPDAYQKKWTEPDRTFLWDPIVLWTYYMLIWKYLRIKDLYKQVSVHLPLFIVFDSASAMSVLDLFNAWPHVLSSSLLRFVSMRSCFMSKLLLRLFSSSKLLPNGLEQALEFVLSLLSSRFDRKIRRKKIRFGWKMSLLYWAPFLKGLLNLWKIEKKDRSKSTYLLKKVVSGYSMHHPLENRDWPAVVCEPSTNQMVFAMKLVPISMAFYWLNLMVYHLLSLSHLSIHLI